MREKSSLKSPQHGFGPTTSCTVLIKGSSKNRARTITKEMLGQSTRRAA